MLTTYMKLLNLYPDQVSEQINEVFAKYSTSCYLELQQRACEYKALPSIAADTMEVSKDVDAWWIMMCAMKCGSFSFLFFCSLNTNIVAIIKLLSSK